VLQILTFLLPKIITDRRQKSLCNKHDCTSAALICSQSFRTDCELMVSSPLLSGQWSEITCCSRLYIIHFADKTPLCACHFPLFSQGKWVTRFLPSSNKERQTETYKPCLIQLGRINRFVTHLKILKGKVAHIPISFAHCVHNTIDTNEWEGLEETPTWNTHQGWITGHFSGGCSTIFKNMLPYSPIYICQLSLCWLSLTYLLLLL
jgi:hypothetical protein